jgi:hypothetical protein
LLPKPPFANLPMHRKFLLLAFLLLAAVAQAQDVLTLGSGQAAASGSVGIPVYVRDVSGTPLGVDAGGGKRIQGIAFKVLFPTELVQSVSFARTGVTAAPSPLFQSTPSGADYASVLLSFSESASPLALGLNAGAPGNQIGTLTVTLKPAVPAGSTALLTLHPASAMLSNQAGTTSETVANGNLALVNGSVTVTTTLSAPGGLVATAVSTTQVQASWVGVGGANHYEIWRSSHNGATALAGTAAGTTFADLNVTPGTTYLYRVRAIDAGGGASPFSNLDLATTILFTDDPVAALTTLIKAVHVTEARDAVNAMRVAAGLLPLADDPTIAVGAPVRAQHMIELRFYLNDARLALGLPALTFTDAGPTQGVTVVKAVHMQEVRNAVK